MEIDRLLLILATLAFAGGLVHAMVAIKAGTWKKSSWHLLPMVTGFILQTAFLYLRGQDVGRCPLTNLFEVLIFICWSIVLLYFLVGSTYRLSLLGGFTAPLVGSIQIIGLVLPIDSAPSSELASRPVNSILELHAAISLIAYAAFALACTTGVMYLLQERLLKQHRIGGLFYQLPPIQGLARAIQRLALLGFVLLSAGLGLSFGLDASASNPKLIFAWLVWALYALICFFMWRHVLSPRQTAWLAVIGFALPFFSLWIVT